MSQDPKGKYEPLETKDIPVKPGGAQEYRAAAVRGLPKRRSAFNIERLLLLLVVLFMVAVFGLLVYDAIISVNTATNALPPVVPTPK